MSALNVLVWVITAGVGVIVGILVVLLVLLIAAAIEDYRYDKKFRQPRYRK